MQPGTHKSQSNAELHSVRDDQHRRVPAKAAKMSEPSGSAEQTEKTVLQKDTSDLNSGRASLIAFKRSESTKSAIKIRLTETRS